MSIDVPALLERLEIRYDRRGDELWARCPAHDDRRPSWSINATSGIHHCFPCSFGGKPVDLVEAVLGLSRAEARDWLRGSGTIGATRDGQALALRPPDQQLKRACMLPAGVKGIGQEFERWPTPVRRYVERRGFAIQVRRWGIGYALSGKQAGRIVFPTRDRDGRLLCYNGRSFLDDDGPKYRRPGRDEAWDRSAVFGEQHWPDDRRTVLVTEGEINALAVERTLGQIQVCWWLTTGIAALAGSNLLDQQVCKLSTFDRLFVISDPDDAGDKLWAALQSKLGRWASLRRVRLNNEDGDAAEMSTDKLAAMIRQETRRWPTRSST